MKLPFGFLAVNFDRLRAGIMPNYLPARHDADSELFYVEFADEGDEGDVALWGAYDPFCDMETFHVMSSAQAKRAGLRRKVLRFKWAFRLHWWPEQFGTPPGDRFLLQRENRNRPRTFQSWDEAFAELAKGGSAKLFLLSPEGEKLLVLAEKRGRNMRRLVVEARPVTAEEAA